jgi:hypothetical protein
MIELPVTPSLKDDFNTAAIRFSDAEDAVSRIVMVGALLENPAGVEKTLSISDHIHLVFALQAGTLAGLGIRPDFSLAIQNREYGHDFLKTPPNHADLVIFSHIYFNPHTTTHTILTQQSDRAHEAGLWHAALMQSGARAAINIHANGPELPTDRLDRPPYRLIDSRRGPTGMQYDILKRV